MNELKKGEGKEFERPPVEKKQPIKKINNYD